MKKRTALFLMALTAMLALGADREGQLRHERSPRAMQD